ncbi:MAG TPA: type II CAAX endopeptidase family protein [bacterium]|nr:type II CAAX endopeptidase family protein [bacterium]
MWMNIKGLLNREETPDLKTAVLIILSVVIYPLVLHLSAIFSGKDLPADSDYFLYSGIINTLLITFFLIVFIFARFRHYIFSVLKTPRKYFVRGLFAYLAFIPALILITIATNYFLKSAGINPEFQEIVRLYLKSDSYTLLALVFFSSCIVAPIAEEIIYRGIIYRALKMRFSVSSSIIISGAIFALIHCELSSLPALFFLGMIMSYLFEKFNNLWASIGLHFFNNFFANLALFIIKFTGVIDIEKFNFEKLQSAIWNF